MAEKVVYSKCGFHCNRCPAFSDNSGTDADRKRGSAVWEKYFGLHFNPDIVRCAGCQSPEPWKTGNLLPDRRCPIRACAVHNGVPTCGHCGVFPCSEYTSRVPGADLRQQREEVAHIRITGDEYLAHIEPFEGQVHLSQLRATIPSEDIIPPRPFSAGEHIAPFPKETTLTPGKRREMSRLHSLLSTVFSQKDATYAGQIVLERGKPYLWGVIWVMGLYGEIKHGRLTLDSSVCGDRKECSRLVRKYDTTLHNAVRDAVSTLSRFGIQMDFNADRKNWTLTLGIDKGVGGLPVLAALKTYVSSLAAKYGEPVYVSSYSLKGKAFKLFTRVDMSHL
jgi:hypothetical protein